MEAQAAFKEKNALPFTLLADEDHEVADAYGAWVLKQRPSGEEYWGVQRCTFIIGSDGRMTHVFGQVDPAKHATELLQALRA